MPHQSDATQITVPPPATVGRPNLRPARPRPRARGALERLRRLAERPQERAPHALRIGEPGPGRDALDGQLVCLDEQAGRLQPGPVDLPEKPTPPRHRQPKSTITVVTTGDAHAYPELAAGAIGQRCRDDLYFE
jgi:hypothetical protein